MRVLYYQANTILPQIMGTILDEMQKDIYNGNEVLFLGCNADLLSCPQNPFKRLNICRACTYCKKHDLGCLSKDINQYNLRDFIFEKDEAEMKQQKFRYKTVTDIKNIYYDGVDIGYSALSTYITKTKTVHPKIDNSFIKIFDKYLLTSIYIYTAFNNAYKSIKPDKIVIFNGRFHTTRPVLRFAQKNNIPIVVLEVIGGKINQKYEKVYFHNCLPHDLRVNTKNIKDLWENSEKNFIDKKQIAENYFIKKSEGKAINDYSFTGRQEKGLLPKNFNHKIKNISIYGSSDFEMAAIGKEREGSPYGSNQILGVTKIMKSIYNAKDLHVYYRIHPNMRKVNKKQLLLFTKLEHAFDNLTIIYPESQIDSYALLKASNIVIAFGSTIGIEAVFWRKPVILLAKTIYMNLGGTYNPMKHEEVISLIKQDLKPLDIKASLMFGFYQLSRKGETFRHFDPNVTKNININRFFLTNYRFKCNKNIYQKIKYSFRKYTILLLSKILSKIDKFRIPKK